MGGDECRRAQSPPLGFQSQVAPAGILVAPRSSMTQLSNPLHGIAFITFPGRFDRESGCSSVGRASASQAEGRRFESGRPLWPQSGPWIPARTVV